MSHYAQLDENNIVIQVVCLHENEERDNRFFLFHLLKKSPEYFGVKFLQKLYPNTKWKKTCSQTISNKHLKGEIPFRGNYAAIGGIYNEKNDVFYLPQPEPSFVLDEKTWNWKEPYPSPSSRWEDEKNWYFWKWSEKSYNENNENGWILESIEKPQIAITKNSGCTPTEDELKLI